VKEYAVDVVVVGAGPAGIMAALAAASHGRKAALVERQPSPGVKLCATGGGRGNLTNTLPEEDFLRRFGRKARFVAPALRSFGPRRLRSFLNESGVPTTVEDGWRVYPVSGRASDVRDALVRRLGRSGVELFVGAEVDGLIGSSGRVLGVRSTAGTFSCRAVVLAAGGMTRSDLGGNESGYALAKQAGHSIVRPLPALSPIRASDPWVGRLAGVVLPNAGLRAGRGGAGAVSSGSVLFTHSGISGPAALDISGFVAESLAAGPIELLLNCDQDSGREEWLHRFREWRKAHGARRIVNLLDMALPASFAEVVAETAGVNPARVAAELTADETGRLIESLTGLHITAVGVGSMDEAMVTRGGVELSEVDPKRLASRKAPGLFFAGEILDVDGPTGGFNLQWAFSSGWLAGYNSNFQV